MKNEKVTEISEDHIRGNELLRKILLATDGSEDAAVATRVATDLAYRSGSDLHVVHVFEFVPPREFVSLALRIRSPFASEREGSATLADQVSLIEGAGGEVRQAHLRMGSPVDGILDTAQEIKASLVIVGSRGLGGVKRLMMGSVSERVVHYATCPVLVVRSGGGAWPPSRILVADDGSEHALRAGALAALIGGLFGAKMTLAQVYPRALESKRTGGSLEARIVNDELRRAEELLIERAGRLEPVLGRHTGVQLLADEGSETIDGIAMTLLDTARKADEPPLIAVGSRGVGLVKRVRMGSVSTKVVRAASGPVLVCPPQRVGAEPTDDTALETTREPYPITTGEAKTGERSRR